MITRPCFLCLEERQEAVQSPHGLKVNRKNVCAEHYRQVKSLRSRIYMAEHEPELWAVVLEQEAKEAEVHAEEHRVFFAVLEYANALAAQRRRDRLLPLARAIRQRVVG